MKFLLIYIVWLAITSVITFAAYGWDKRCARLNKRRIPEKSLHALALLGGWPGALMGQTYFRHKTQKFGFQVTTWAIVILHGIVIFALIQFRTIS